MPETPATHKEIVNIKKDISDIKATQELDIRLNRDKYVDHLNRVIGNSAEKAKVFLAVDGKKSVVEITKTTKLNPVQVRRSARYLKKHGLIFLVAKKENSKVYAKYRWAHVLNADDWIRNKFGNALD